MTELVIMRNKSAVTTSLMVAEVFGKEHKHVLRDIRKLLDSEEVSRYFMKLEYLDKYGRSQECYSFTKEGFLLLTARYTGKDVLEKKLEVLEGTDMVSPTLPERKEVEFMEMLDEVLESWGLVVEKQKKVNNFYLDGYIESLNLAIEYDEKHHKFNVEHDNKRQMEIEKETNCRFVRISDDKNHAYNVGLVLKEVAKLTAQN